jgi:hypothetical protein
MSYWARLCSCSAACGSGGLQARSRSYFTRNHGLFALRFSDFSDFWLLFGAGLLLVLVLAHMLF